MGANSSRPVPCLRRSFLLQTVGSARRIRDSTEQEGDRAGARWDDLGRHAVAFSRIASNGLTLVAGSDGLAARQVHAWSDEKLFYVQAFMDIFTTGMKAKWSRLVYADFFAGPGRNVDESTQQEGLGSPLRALEFDGFTKLFFNDSNPEAVSALRQRVGPQRENRVLITQLDCNNAVDAARQFLFPNGTARNTLGLAFIDPTAYEMRFESIRRFTSDVRVALIITFMTNFVRRFRGQPGFDEGSNFDLFMGTREWLKLRDRRPSPGFTRDLLDIYESNLATLGYVHVDDDARILNTQRSSIYHLVFASKHERGADFFAKISQRDYSGQRRLF